MEVILDSDCALTTTCYLPHHPVVKASSTTTKTRVVFDTSAETTTGKSLKDVLMGGAQISTVTMGADKELRSLCETVSAVQKHESVTEFSSREGICWHLIPPQSPHFRGIWEAGVKSFKFHLRRVMGMACLSFEEFATLITQIEGCLNSRPLVALSNDPNYPSALTPSHFLIGQLITSIPQPDLIDVRIGLLSRWQKLQRQLQQFRKKWSNDYLTNLQQRNKWSIVRKNIYP
ncbi:uncharacterized protein LOC124165880 [Ischnura elegans]|uniref:uncharacterized protein LOC124165880 n=1 Tax=Ischnura elegans TaxID=197161 RepID=UPI001ED8927F|nr:uncharacterized protein LOC124165880 [Ischnura elegans]